MKPSLWLLFSLSTILGATAGAVPRQIPAQRQRHDGSSSSSSSITASSSSDWDITSSSAGARPSRSLASSAVYSGNQDQSLVTLEVQPAAAAQCPPSKGVSLQDMDALRGACGEQLFTATAVIEACGPFGACCPESLSRACHFGTTACTWQLVVPDDRPP
jgi:hypothetical protein